MSAVPDPQVDLKVIEQERRRLSRRLEEVARLCEANLPPATFYGELLKRLLESLAAPAGAVWARTPQGNLQLQFQANLKEVGLDRSEDGRKSHEELLRQAVIQPRPLHLLPHSSAGAAQEGMAPAGNPTDFLLLLVPIMLNEQVAGLIEVWQAPNRPLNAVPGFLQFMGLMADLATRYLRNQMIGQMTGQQQLWTQLETFARHIHGSLNPTEVSYLVANEGRRLIECDRVSVATRQGRRCRIEAISGADVVEKRSNLVQLMRVLCNEVVAWGEKLVFAGTKDDTLPPKVLEALDNYLAESPSKLLVVQPLIDERETGDKEKKEKPKQPARSVIVMECFEPPADAQQIIARLDIVSRHASSALYNAVEHRRIPMRFVWVPLAKMQEGLGGKARAISALIVVALSLLISALILVPYPLKMDSTGNLMPVARRVVCPPVTGTVKSFNVKAGSQVSPRANLARMYDMGLWNQMMELSNAARAAGEKSASLRSVAATSTEEKDRIQYQIDADVERELQKNKQRELDALISRTGASVQGAPGYFSLLAPEFTDKELVMLGNRREWTVLNSNFEEEWIGRQGRPSEPILRLGAKDGPWEIELKIPQKHIGQVLAAFNDETSELDVDFLLRSDPTKTYRGRLSRDKIAGEANPVKDDNNENEPVVLAFVRIEGEGIPDNMRLPREALLAGAEVHAKVRCGNHSLGYSLFYGVWEFVYEKIVFFF